MTDAAPRDPGDRRSAEGRAAGNRRRAARRRPRAPGGRLREGAGTTLLVALLGLALVVSAVLAYQAHDAAGSHEEVAHQTVRDLAHAAAWQFTERSTADVGLFLQNLMVGSLRPTDREDGPPPLAHLVEGAAAWEDCGCPEGESIEVPEPRAFFRLVLDDAQPPAASGSRWAPDAAPPLEWEGERLDDEAAAWLADTLRTLARPDEAREAGGRRPAVGILFREAGEGGVDAFVHFRFGPANRPDAVYGFRVDGEELGEKTLRPVLAREALLPASLTGDLPNDSLFRVEVTAAGRPVLASASGGATGGPPRGLDHARGMVTGAERFPDWLGGMEVRVGVPEERAASLVIGGLPGSRLPMILVLLGLTGGLLAMAILLLRREHQLARLRSDFVAGVTHELRTPLAQIRMFAELLSSGTLTGTEERGRAVDVIDQEARRLDQLVDNVLGFARMSASAPSLSLRPTRLDGLLDEVLEGFRPLAESRRVKIAPDVEGGVAVVADRDAVHRVLLNLLDNAVKYGPRGQTVRVGIGRQGGRVRIQVDDEGPGVPPSQRDRIWKPYQRLVHGDRGAAGSGLGLAVVRRLVEAQGGSVEVGDAPGGGARFAVLLPAAEGEPPAPPDAAAATVPGADDGRRATEPDDRGAEAVRR